MDILLHLLHPLWRSLWVQHGWWNGLEAIFLTFVWYVLVLQSLGHGYIVLFVVWFVFHMAHRLVRAISLADDLAGSELTD